MVSRGLALELKPGAYAEYKRRHDHLWPEMIDMLQQLQVSMVIYRHGDTLFVHETAPSQEAFDRADEAPITPKWNEHMKEVLATDGSGELIFTDLLLAFSCGEFAARAPEP